MSERKAKTKREIEFARRFESQAMALESLRLIAAPNPQDDLNDQQVVDYARQKRFPAELIQHLIEHVKSI